MRVFAKDVTGQKLVHGFESRPLRLQIFESRKPPKKVRQRLRRRRNDPPFPPPFFVAARLEPT